MMQILVHWERRYKMEYVVMSLEEAKKVAKKNAIVLVSKQDLENPDCNIGFTKKYFGECNNILEEAASIARVCDEFASQLRVFSEIQTGVPKGCLHTILYNKSDKLDLQK